MEKQPGFRITLPMFKKFLAAVVYGDALMYLSNKIRPYEINPGTTDALAQKWIKSLVMPLTAVKYTAPVIYANSR